MKKMKLFGLMALLTFTLAGCQNTSDREAALEDQVEQLEQQITSLEQENAATHADSSTQEQDKTNSSTTTSTDDLDSLTKAVNDVVKKAEAIDASGSNDEQQAKFFEIKSELQDVENRLELYEDLLEDDYRQNKITYEESRNAEIEIEKLEDLLDNAEDRLEHLFGYDD